MLKEFRKFGMRGNVIDTAVGIVTGAAFGKLVTSFVNDGLMPPLGMRMGGMDFSKPFINPGSEACPSLAAARESGAATLKYEHRGGFLGRCVRHLHAPGGDEQAEERGAGQGSCYQVVPAAWPGYRLR